MVSQKKILIVEDNEINRMMLSSILSPQYQVLEAENGQQALEVLAARSEDISLILLDIVMPVMDGYTFLSAVKADASYSSIPVIVTTQSEGESDELAALSHGATDFVVKPYKPQIILHRVASIIKLRETAAMINQFQYDRLTGLYSKEFFYRRAREILLQHPEEPYDILCSDIENFKLINDVFGMPAGDALLQGIAKLFLEGVDERGICGRFNADQFVCLLPHPMDYTDALFIDATAQVNGLSQMKNIVLKWGIYPVENRTVPVEQMCDRALLAARSIKGQYGKYFAAYDDTLRGKLLREQAITDGMEAALAQGQFVVYLQPKYHIQDDVLAGAEALVRWVHPEWGFQSPAQFIPLFEKNGFITKLDQFVWDKTCAILRKWEDAGYPPLPVSVNVSRADIYNADLADILMKTVEKYNLPPSRLHLEITESAYTEGPDQLIETVGRLRALGFVIEMDDFGSGYSSLNMLHEMPLDILKLDMKFIQSETAKPVSQGILRFIMGLARWMNLSVVAEGVETKEQLERLREIGCDYVQGYYFAKPMPWQQFEALFKQRPRVTRQETPQPGAPLSDRPGPVLLVADEDAAYRHEVCLTFESRFQILEAADLETALAYMAGYGHKIAAAVLSMTLPAAGTAPALEMMRREKAVWDIPLLATGTAGPGTEEEALEGGADDFAGKPHTPKSLEKRVQRIINCALLRRRERALQEEAYSDSLTGLLNRRGLEATARGIQPESAPLAVYLFDLDNLRHINDTLGHKEGDRLIGHFGALLRSRTRRADILARFTGDEFVVIMKRTGPEEALQRGEQLCRSMRQSPLSQAVSVSSSAGVALWDAAKPLAQILDRADEALRRAKAQHKGGCCLWNE